MMKPKYVIAVFVTMICCSAWAGLHCYRCAEQEIVADMDQALARTLRSKQEIWITPDTIRDYRSNLRLSVLRRHSVVSYAEDGDPKTVVSNKMVWNKGDRRIAFRGYANCSALSVLMLSDQRAALSLLAMSLLWLAVAFLWERRHTKDMEGSFGGLRYDESSRMFYDARRMPVHFTPMQRQLLQMFLAEGRHSLRKEDICATLWPRKPDAGDTLYTLIRRLRSVLEASSSLTITTERGGEYRLSDRCQSHN